MNKDEIEIIGKQVKDMYGTYMGKVIGTITDIDGSIQTVGIDCGLDGLKQVPFEQLVVQGDVVIFIPKWRLDAQRFLREKGLTIRRLKALIDIVSENDEMREDAEIIHEKYKSKLLSLEESEKEISTTLAARLEELNAQLKLVKTLLFDAKVQFKSNEISESKFDLVKTHTGELIEHIDHEKAEILNIQRRIADIALDGVKTNVNQQEQIQQSAVSYLVTNTASGQQVETPNVPPSTSEVAPPSGDENKTTNTDAEHQEPLTANITPPSAEPNKDASKWHGAVPQVMPATQSGGFANTHSENTGSECLEA
ncbi:MAG TPA: CdvA-like protein [Candidatus Nitrosotenuis sp.]|nr:CdvA-like protein [Candidatus Nitrosotenuis sp.]